MVWTLFRVVNSRLKAGEFHFEFATCPHRCQSVRLVAEMSVNPFA